MPDHDDSRTTTAAPPGPPTKTKRTGTGAESSRKVLSLLLSFTEDRHTQTVQELADYLEVPASTAYRYVGQLREFGLLEEADQGGYRVSMRAIGLARAANAGSAGLSAIAHPIVVRLSRETGESALMVRRLGHAVVAVDMEESTRPVRLRFERGALMSLHQGSAARVLLASLTPRERANYYQSVWSIEANPQLPTDAELAQIAEQGWSESFGQVEDGIWGTASAIHSRQSVIAAISVAGPLYRLEDGHRADIIAAVRQAAADIDAALAANDFG